MSAAGDCYDNALAESFFATLEKELVHGCAFQTRTEAYDAISDYIENYYKRQAAPFRCSKPTPIAFELAHAAQLAAETKLSNCPEIPGNSKLLGRGVRSPCGCSAIVIKDE